MLYYKRKNISRDVQRADNGKIEEQKQGGQRIYANRLFSCSKPPNRFTEQLLTIYRGFIMELQKRKRGRPCGVTPEKLSKLDEGFLLGLNDLECCLYADISTSAFYRYIDKHPEYRERKERLKKRPTIQAKKNISELLDNGDEITSRWYLEKRSEEFSAKHDITVDTSGSLSLEARSDALKGFLRQFLDD